MKYQTLEKDVKRKSWLDLGRGISILLVILFHSENTIGITGFHWSTLVSPFRMPLFFFISGYLFTSCRFNFTISKKLAQLFRGIVVPYLIFTSILIIPKSLFHEGNIEGGLREIFMGWASWFVVALCGTQILFAICLHCTKKLSTLLILSISLFGIGLLVHSIYPNRLPFYLNYSLLIAPFFYAGFIYRIYESKLENLNRYKWLLILAGLYFSCIILDMKFLNTDLSFFNDKLTTYQNIPLSLIYSFLGVLMMVILLKIMPSIPVIEFIGKNSLIFYYLNGGCLKIFNAISNIFKFNHTEFPEYIVVFLLLIITTITIYQACIIIRKYCPLLVGDKTAFNSLKTQFKRQTPINSQDYMYIDFTRAILIVLVVMIHVPVYFNLPYFDSFIRIFPRGICNIAVPAFFVISGYLFKLDNFNLHAFKNKYYNRLFTLVVPYFIWNAFAILILVIPHLDIYHNISFSNFITLFWDTSKSFLNTPGTSPIDYPLWYVRDLILCLLLFPVLFICTQYLSWVLPMFLVGVWVSGYNYIGISLISISFFSIGYWLRTANMNLFYNKKIIIALTCCGIACLVMNIYYEVEPIFRIGVICGVFSIFTIAQWMVLYLPRIANAYMKVFSPSFVFFLYCSHAIYIKYLGNSTYTYLFDILGLSVNWFTAAICYFTTLILTLIIAYSIFKMGYFLSPKFVGILIGNRFRKSIIT